MATPLVHAAALEGLFEIEIPIQNQGSDERSRAIRTGFYELVLRLTGTRDAANSPSAAALTAKAAEYVVQYRYRTLPPITLNPTSPQGTAIPPDNLSTEPKQVLWILFDGETVSQALYKNHLPFWGRIRPNLVVWLVMEDLDHRRQLVDASLPSPIVDAAVTRARLRGIPLIFPTLDQQDQATLTTTDAWNKLNTPILKASARYQAEGILLGRITADNSGRWNARWTLLINNAELDWEHAQEPAVIGAEAIDHLADNLGRQLAQASADNTPTSAVIVVNEVKSLEHYLKTLRYLESLEPVARARVIQLDGQKATYHLELRGTTEAVARTIGASNVLIVEHAPNAAIDPAASKNTVLNYRLVP